MKPNRYCLIVLATLCALLSATRGNGQLVSIVPNIGSDYGITAWYNVGWQNAMSDSLFRDKTIGGYGINLKYGAQRIFLRSIDSSETKRVCNECEGRMETVKVYDSTYYLRVSFGLGYLGYFGLASPLAALDAEFDVGAPYAGLYASLPLYFLDEESPVSLTLGYTSAVVSAENVLGTYRGPAVAGDRTNFPLTFTIPTTITHEFSSALTFRRRFFISMGYQLFNVKNVRYTPIGEGIPKDTLQTNLGGNLDLSFISLKTGVSFDF